MHFLDYVIASAGVSMEEDRIQSVKNWRELKSLREIQVFVGFANFYRRFIKGFSRLAAPLTEMIKQSPLSREGPSTQIFTSLTKMTRQSSPRDRGSERTVSVQRDPDASSTQSTEMTRQSPLRDIDSDRVVSVPRDVDTSRGTTQGSRGSDGAVYLVQRNAVVGPEVSNSGVSNWVTCPVTGLTLKFNTLEKVDN